MNQAGTPKSTAVDQIVRAVLYEGYILYPYRPSVKNRQRWTFGGLMPRAYCEAQRSGDAWTAATECLLTGGAGSNRGLRDAALDVKLGFLQPTDRQVGQLSTPVETWPADGEPSWVPVAAMYVDDAEYHTWQEAVERRVDSRRLAVEELVAAPYRQAFSFPASRGCEPLYNARGEVVGVLVREQQPLCGELEVRAEMLAQDLFKVIVRVTNGSPWEPPAGATRDAALLRALVSTHAVLRVAGSEFVSLLETPESWRAAAAGCRQSGLWPVLVGEAGQRDTVLASPIILYDYPQVAAESPGDLFDGGEIDEILTLRILTLTADEKRAMAAVDAQARALLERTESLCPAELAGLHGTIRERRYVSDRGASVVTHGDATAAMPAGGTDHAS